MAHSHAALMRDTDFDPQTGTPVRLAPGIVRLTAPNAGPYTFTGTNTFLLGETRVLVIDPGPEDEPHLDALLRAIGGRPVDAVVLTHTHRDHSALAPALARAVDAPLRFAVPNAARDGGAITPDAPISNDQTLETDGITLSAVATPGHSADHFGFAVNGTPLFLSGDHVMGWSTTLVAAPEGLLSDYFASLDRVIALEQTQYLPAHGGAIADGRAQAQALKAHRMSRNTQILEALAAGPKSRNALIAALYPEIESAVLGAARMTLEAHLIFLADQGAIAPLTPQEDAPIRPA